MRDAIRHRPARLMTPDERALVSEWLATAGDVASVYISGRRSDDPAFYGRIVIAVCADGEPSHVAFAASGRDIWVVLASGRRMRIRRFRTLRAALNSIRPVLLEAGDADARNQTDLKV